MGKTRTGISLLAMAALLAGCGGGGGGSSSSGAVAVTPTPPPTSTSSCSLRARQDWAASVLNEWYLFPETLPAALDPTPYASVNTYIDALTATARGQSRDRFFTHIASIAEENAFFSSGASAGFGVRLNYDTANNRVFIAEAFENAPAFAAGIDRATELLAIGEVGGTLRTVASIMAAEGAAGVSSALGPTTAGVTRVLRISNAAGTSEVTVTKATYELQPISARYGAKVIDDGGRKVAYLNLRTFISTADGQLRTAFGQFRAEGISEFIIDFRYNGGGLVSTAELMGNLMAANRLASDIFSITTFRPEKASNNSTDRFAVQPQSVAPVKIAFIATGSTASASELVMNSMLPYLGQNAALVGSNSFGKPVGQIAVDRSACDDRVRVVAFSTQNSANQGFYYGGLAASFPNRCAATDDVTRPLGDPQEASVREALNFLGGRGCTSLTLKAPASASQRAIGERGLLSVETPSVAQREVPGLF